MNLDSQNWFTETADELGSAFSLQIKQRLHQEQTRYQHLEIYATTHFGHLMVLDGFIMLSQRDNFIYHEMLSHPSLFSHPEPNNVVIIGGGDCGTLQQVLKHSVVQQVSQIEIDERVTRNAERFFPELCTDNQDPRVNLKFEDGIAWIDNAAAGSIDVIIVDSTDPVGPAAGLFQEPFYRACHQALSEQGVLVQQSESPLAHADSIIYPMRRAMRNAGFADVQTLFFPVPVYPTGWWSATLAAKQAPLAIQRPAAAVAPDFTTRYYNAAIHKAAFAEPTYFSVGEDS